MRYVDRVVSRDEDENVVYTAFLSVWSLLPNFVFGSLLFTMSVLSLMKLGSYGMESVVLPACFGFGIVGLAVLVHAIAKYYTTENAITNKQVITKPSMIARDGTRLLLNKCESCNLKQSIMGRILNYGSIVISGAGDTNAVISDISDPMRFQDIYDECHKNSIA